jgi:holo-[acyl-carrier protein] synthase
MSWEPQEGSGAVLSVGTDIVECVRIAQMIDRHGELFLHRVYTIHEIAYCSARRSCTQHYAGRWAAKEAVLKVLGTGWSRGIRWTDIEVTNAASGSPSVSLYNQAAEIATKLKIANILITISHCRSYAVAYATAIA